MCDPHKKDMLESDHRYNDIEACLLGMAYAASRSNTDDIGHAILPLRNIQKLRRKLDAPCSVYCINSNVLKYSCTGTLYKIALSLWAVN